MVLILDVDSLGSSGVVYCLLAPETRGEASCLYDE